MSEGDKSRFRWLDVARYILAFVMVVLIVAVIINAIKVVLRPDSLSLSIVGGSIPSRRYPPSVDPDPECSSLSLDLNVRFRNPSGRARMYYTNITAYLFDNMTAAWNSDSDPEHLEDESFNFFTLKDKYVPELETVNSYKEVNVRIDNMDDDEFHTLCKGGSLREVTMRLEGTLITEVLSGVNASTLMTTYYCGQLLLGGNPDDPSFQNGPDVSCSEVQGNHVVQ